VKAGLSKDYPAPLMIVSAAVAAGINASREHADKTSNELTNNVNRLVFFIYLYFSFFPKI